MSVIREDTTIRVRLVAHEDPEIAALERQLDTKARAERKATAGVEKAMASMLRWSRETRELQSQVRRYRRDRKAFVSGSSAELQRGFEDVIASKETTLKWVRKERAAALKRLAACKADLDERKREARATKRKLGALRKSSPPSSMYRIDTGSLDVAWTDDEYQERSVAQKETPIAVATADGERLWWYLDRFWFAADDADADAVAELVATQERSRRKAIRTSVRHEVWRRDQGRCVDCGSRENLELDHIVPLSKGGSNTARNIELRCESCNRRKGARI